MENINFICNTNYNIEIGSKVRQQQMRMIKDGNYNKKLSKKICILKRLMKNSFARDVILWSIIIIFFSLVLSMVYYIVKNRALNNYNTNPVLKVEIDSPLVGKNVSIFSFDQQQQHVKNFFLRMTVKK